MSAIDRPATAEGLSETRKGVAFCIMAHLVWGVMTFYFKLIGDVSPIEIAVHRGVWSIFIAGAIIWYLGQFDAVRRAIVTPRIFLALLFTGLLTLSGWSFYIWAIQVGRTLDASLGFYVNPLMNVAAGALFLGERFTRVQLMAFGLAAVAVLIQIVATGTVPWIGLALSTSFCVYGLVRKMTPVGATEGFFIEVLVIFLPSLAIAAWLVNTGEARFLTTPFYTLMLMGCGVFTATALIFFAAAIKRIRYSTAGLLQYISPSIVFLTAVFLFGEPMNVWRWLAFGLLWVALAVYSYSALEQAREPTPT
jgi:chloramphenicol-sensitive protein RarD